jgi:hypothetical protein
LRLRRAAEAAEGGAPDAGADAADEPSAEGSAVAADVQTPAAEGDEAERSAKARALQTCHTPHTHAHTRVLRSANSDTRAQCHASLLRFLTMRRRCQQALKQAAARAKAKARRRAAAEASASAAVAAAVAAAASHAASHATATSALHASSCADELLSGWVVVDALECC